jgi:branched-chain amino acid transport system ATP-binding protein
MNSMEVLRVDKLSKSYGGLQVLKNISFTAKTGERLAIIGPNGAGKTTLFGVLGGQLDPTDGRVYLSGQDITNLTPYRRLHLGLARSFQINNLFLRLTLMDNILLAIKGSRYPHFRIFHSVKSDRDLFADAQGLLELMGLWEMRLAPVTALSYGDQRRLEIAFAFASNPKLVLLDEPSAGLTTADAMAFADTIRKSLKDTVLIFCAHDMDLVFELADRVMVLHYGEIICEGTCDEIKRDLRVREIYLGNEGSPDDAGSR